MRCYCCDYSPDTPSLFHSGLSMHKTKKKITYSPKGPICSDCLLESYFDTTKQIEPDKGEVEHVLDEF